MKFLIAGLGNFGLEYKSTRHNIGFDVVDNLAARFDCTFESKRFAERAKFRHKGRQFFLIKPTTFMNLSGKAVRYWLNKLGLELEQLLIVVDEVNLPLGAIRLRSSGSDGGHNGLENIIEILGTRNFSRMRIGIGDDYPRGGQSDYVLGEWSSDELNALKPRIDTATDAILSYALQGISRTMNQYNTTG